MIVLAERKAERLELIDREQALEHLRRVLLVVVGPPLPPAELDQPELLVEPDRVAREATFSRQFAD